MTTMTKKTPTEFTCAHCTLPVPAGLVREAAEHQFCCPGCRAVFEQIHACGLDDYYRLRDAAGLELKPAEIREADTAAFDSDAYDNLYVRHGAQNAECATEFVLEGVSCAACVWLIERLPRRLDGLIDARLGLTDATVRLTWDPRRLKLSTIAAELLRFGYRPHPARGTKQADLHKRELRRRLMDVGAAGAMTGNLMLLAAALYAGWFSGIDRPYEALMRWLSVGLGIVCLAWPGREFFTGAIAALRLRTVNFDVPIALALFAGGVAGTINVIFNRGEIYFDSLSALIFLLLIGRLLQFCQQRRAQSAVELLFSLTPATCRRIENDTSVSIPIQSLEVGDVVEVWPGELIPADGEVIDGVSSIDQSLLTGETKTIPATRGTFVFGGARNTDAKLRIAVRAVGESTRVGRLMRLLEQGLADKPPIVRLTDRVASRFTFLVIGLALLTFLVWLPRTGAEVAINHVVSLLIVTCPCVLGLAVPLTFALTIGRLARRDILVKSAAVLERLAKPTRVVLDKTGTLTEGRMRVVRWVGDESWRGVVARLEAESAHPIGRALSDAYESIEPPAGLRREIAHRRERAGGGVEASLAGHDVLLGSPRLIASFGAFCPPDFEQTRRDEESQGNTVVLLAVDGVVRALAILCDQLRAEAPGTVARLRQLGYKPSICSGDVQGVVNRVAASLAIVSADALGGMSPEEKLSNVKSAPSLMIGDGVNDAAALAAADVGVAVRGGAEASLAAADVYIARPGLDGVIELIVTARHTLGVVRRNVVVALAYNGLAASLAIGGYMHPLLAAILMPMSSITVLSLTAISVRRGPRLATARSAEERTKP